jgi:hypothetical protein
MNLKVKIKWQLKRSLKKVMGKSLIKEVKNIKR